MLAMEAGGRRAARSPRPAGAELGSLLEACRSGDRCARERLVESAMPLVRSLARRYANRGERLEDLVQVGSIGLIHAIDRFDPDRGDDFFRFAVPTITGEIRHHLRDRASVIRTPRGGGAEKRWVGEPRRVSLSTDGGTGAGLEAALTLDRTFEPSDDRLLLAAAFRALRARERRILHLRFFAGLSQDEIAREVGLSQVQVSRLIRSSLERMRAAIDGPRSPSASESSLAVF
jgi:RNA polymerase sigma-B factor